MSTIRQEQVAQLLVQELSDMLRRNMKDPRLAGVTVTDAEISRDLSYARVYVSVHGTEEERHAALAALKKVSGYLRGEFTRRARLRVAPEIVFLPDEGIERGMRIYELLKEIEAETGSSKTETS